MSGTAVALMLLGRDAEPLPPARGRPAGRLDDWFPRAEFAVDASRLDRMHFRHFLSLSLAGNDSEPAAPF
ncbi:hypothetical protein CDD83_6913 [Cordyceps sp. RAO-2017]|nr:hypothetical protein CDD83_6913 [Cordyceps sp. RAO-2017]